MNYTDPDIARVAKLLEQKLEKLAPSQKRSILRSAELKSLFDQVKLLPPQKRPIFGKEANKLRSHLETMVESAKLTSEKLPAIDLTAPFDVNVSPDKRPAVLSPDEGSRHPLMAELELILDIFYRMGFNAIESRQIDDDYHMFGSLNFPEDHPARDDYDTFMTSEGFIAPAHTSTMQNRVMKLYKSNLDQDLPIAVVIPGRVFRNEDVDPRHEHTFYQLEGVYIDKGVNVGHLIATLKTFLQAYYNKELEVKTQPFYFPFTEPSFEFALSCPFCEKAGCNICSFSGWIELLGCGLIHPNVLKEAGIDPTIYSGFAWGGGIDRLVMMKYDIEDVRHFEAGKLSFLRQF
jgi:phenylalanyl-tRNA synthetase alpha chain